MSQIKIKQILGLGTALTDINTGLGTKLAIADFDTAVATINGNVTTVSDNLAAEIARATGIEGALRTDVDAASTAITAETTRATGIEGGLRTDIDAEIARATAAETALRTDLTNATGDTTELRTDLDAEIARATGIEGTLRTDVDANATAITAETTRATGIEGTLRTDVDAATAAITAETTRATGIENGLRTDIDAAGTAITAETTRATGVEAGLRTDVDNNAAAITAETTRATAAEGTLQTNIDAASTAVATETTRATTAEGVLRTDLTTVSDDLATEVTRATNAETALGADITALTAATIKHNGSTAFTADQSMGGFRLTNLSAPTVGTDAATRAFVESSVAAGIVGGVKYQGTADGSAADPAAATGDTDFAQGALYRITVAGSAFGFAANEGDFAIYNGTDWDVIDSTDPGVTQGAGITVTPTGDTSYNVAISNTYNGQASITTVGTLTVGTWNADTIGVAFGGTGITAISANSVLASGAAADAVAPVNLGNNTILGRMGGDIAALSRANVRELAQVREAFETAAATPGSMALITLTNTPRDANAVCVYFNGVKLRPTTDYTIADGVVTATPALNAAYGGAGADGAGFEASDNVAAAYEY